MHHDHLDQLIADPANWLTYYLSRRKRQIHDALFSEGIREPRLGKLVVTIDRLASGSGSQPPMWVAGRTHWLLFTNGGFLRIRKADWPRRPSMHQVRALYS